jgi:tungstate transport system ATP-binding protein
MNNNAIIEIADLRKQYDDACVLDVSSYSFDSGDIYALVGPNGSGKTTLLLILSFLVEKTSGSLRFDGIDLTDHNLYDLRKNVTLVHQEPTMFQATVEKNVAMGLSYRGEPKDVIVREVDRALETVGLLHLKGRNARTLSGGETKRVAIARALAIRPRILLLDEPTANVDIHNVAKIERIIRDVNQRYDTTIIFSTHNLHQAYHIADDVLTLLEGKKIFACGATFQNFPPGEFSTKI